MPYKLRKAPGRDLYWVVNKETKEKYSKEPLPKAKAEAQMRALYSNTKEEIKGGRRISDEALMKVKEYKMLTYHDPFPDHEDVHRWWHLHPNLKHQDFRHSSMKKEDKYPTAMVRLRYLPQTGKYWVGRDWENYVKRGFARSNDYSGYMTDMRIEDVPLEEYGRLLDAGKVGNPNRRWEEVVTPNEYTKLGVRGWYVPPGQAPAPAPKPYVPVVVPKAPSSGVEEMVRRQMEATREAQAKPRNGRGRKKGGATLIQRGKASRLRERFQLDGKLFPLYQWLGSVVHSNNDRDIHAYDGQNPLNTILDGVDANNEATLRKFANMLGSDLPPRYNWNGAPMGNQIIPAPPAGIAPMPPPAPPRPAPLAPWARKKPEAEFEVVGDVVPPGEVDEGDEEEEEEEEEKAPTPPVAPAPPPAPEPVAQRAEANEPPRPPPPPPESEDQIMAKAMADRGKESLQILNKEFNAQKAKMMPDIRGLIEAYRGLEQIPLSLGISNKDPELVESNGVLSSADLIRRGQSMYNALQTEHKVVTENIAKLDAKIRDAMKGDKEDIPRFMKTLDLFKIKEADIRAKRDTLKKKYGDAVVANNKAFSVVESLRAKTNKQCLAIFNLFYQHRDVMDDWMSEEDREKEDIQIGAMALLAKLDVVEKRTDNSAVLGVIKGVINPMTGEPLTQFETATIIWANEGKKLLGFSPSFLSDADPSLLRPARGKGKLKGGAIPPAKELHYMAKQAYEQYPDSNIGQNRLIKHTPTLKFYQNGNNIIVAIRGTADATDWTNNNVRIPFNDLRSGNRYKTDSAVIRDMKNKYSGYEFYGVAHSLGGALLDEFIDDGLIARGLSYNPAVSTKNFNRSGKNERIYNEADPLYNTMGVQLTDKPQVRQNKAKKGWTDWIVSKIPGVGKVLDFGKSALDAHNLDSLEGGATREERGKASYYREKYRGKIPDSVFDALTRMIKDNNTAPYAGNDGVKYMDEYVIPTLGDYTHKDWRGGANIKERGEASELREKMKLNGIYDPDAFKVFNDIIHSNVGFPLPQVASDEFRYHANKIDRMRMPSLSFIEDRRRYAPTEDAPNTEADASPDTKGTRRGLGKGVAGSPTRSAPLSREEYLSRARAKAKSEGYPYKLLGYADDGKHKLQIPNKDGKIIRFGRQGYGDFIIWSAKEASGKVPEGYAKQKRNTFHSSHSKIKGRWRSDLFSPNMLALKILW